MASPTDQQLRQAVDSNDLASLKALLTSDGVKNYGNLGKEEWVYGGVYDGVYGGVYDAGAPLQEAAFRGYDEMVRVLIESGIKVNSFAANGANDRWTALHDAVQGNKQSTVKLLLELGADATLHGKNGYYIGTAQDWAGILKHAECSNILMEHNTTAGARAAGNASSDSDAAKIQLQTVIDKLKTKAEKENALNKGKKIAADLKAKKAELITITEEIAALEADKDYKTEVELKRMQDELDQINELIEAFQSVNGPVVINDNDAKLCPVCFKVPEKVFACGNEEGDCDSWFCTKCKEELTKCPKCRAEFNAVPPRRSIQMEKMLSRKM